MSYKNMSDLWDYLMDVLKLPTAYRLGKFGQLIDGKYHYDCVCLIKSFAWCDAEAGKTPKYKANDINDDWLGNLYTYAELKSSNINELPDEGIWLVYLGTKHIGVYNAATGTVVECCAGQTMRVVERDLHHYDGTQYAWNRWSDLYWCPQGDRNTKSTIKTVVDNIGGMSKEEAENYILTDCIEFLNRLPRENENFDEYISYLMACADESSVDECFKLSEEYNKPYESREYKKWFIIKCYYYLLGRFPENEAVIEHWLSYSRLRDICRDIYNSPEAVNRRTADK